MPIMLALALVSNTADADIDPLISPQARHSGHSIIRVILVRQLIGIAGRLAPDLPAIAVFAGSAVAFRQRLSVALLAHLAVIHEECQCRG